MFRQLGGHRNDPAGQFWESELTNCQYSFRLAQPRIGLIVPKDDHLAAPGRHHQLLQVQEASLHPLKYTLRDALHALTC